MSTSYAAAVLVYSCALLVLVTLGALAGRTVRERLAERRRLDRDALATTVGLIPAQRDRRSGGVR